MTAYSTLCSTPNELKCVSGLVLSDSFQSAQCDMITEAVAEVATKMIEFFFCKDEAKKVRNYTVLHMQG